MHSLRVHHVRFVSLTIYKTLNPFSFFAADRPRSPTLNTSSLVPNVPTPTPTELGPAAVKQLMTWGTLNATPRILSEDDEPVPTPSTPFHIPAPSSREMIGQRLSTGASKSLRAKAEMLGLGLGGKSSGLGIGTPSASKRVKGTMGPPGWTPRKADAPGNLTPAAKRLLDRTTLGTKRKAAW
jgi:protein DGCR14